MRLDRGVTVAELLSLQKGTPHSNVRYVVVDDTTWPVPYHDDEIDGPEWVQRYAPPERVVKQRMRVASIISAYRALLDPSITQAEAIEKLKLARRAAKEAI